jgi:hypothetical protein
MPMTDVRITVPLGKMQASQIPAGIIAMAAILAFRPRGLFPARSG